MLLSGITSGSASKKQIPQNDDIIILKKFRISKEARVGLVVTTGILLLYFGFNFAKGKNLFSTSRAFYAVFENVDDLRASASVQLNGLQVGTVDKIYFLPGTYRIVVKIRIADDNILIPKDSEAKIVSDLLGTRTVDLILGHNATMAASGDTLHSIRQIGITEELKNAILPLKKQIENLAGSVDTVLTGFNNVFNKKTQSGLINSFESINVSIQKLEHTVNEFDAFVSSEKNTLGDIFANVKSITTNLKNNNEQLTHVFTNLDKITDDVAKSNVKQTMDDLQTSIGALQKVISGIEKGEGTLGQLATNDSLYQNLDASSKNLSLLLEDLRLNPKRYVHISLFGGKDKSDTKK